MSMARQLQVEYEAEQYAKEWSINDEKRAAFIAGAAWLARRIARIEDHGPMVEAMASSGTKNYLDELAIKDIRKLLSDLLKWAPAQAEEENARD
jgi:hypothetical protein